MRYLADIAYILIGISFMGASKKKLKLMNIRWVAILCGIGPLINSIIEFASYLSATTMPGKVAANFLEDAICLIVIIYMVKVARVIYNHVKSK